MAGKKRHSSKKARVTELTAGRTPRGKPIGLFVLGMHRSGTSAISRVLNLLGAELGTRLMEPQAGVNDTGFWEDLEVVALHERLLRWRHSSWFDCRPIPPAQHAALIQQTAVAEASGIIRSHFPDSALWAIKDPRLCLFVPTWIQAASALTSRLGFVIFVRNPDEVAASLAKRDGITPGHAYLLWGKHVVESVRASVGKQRTVGVYSRLLDDWRKEIGSIARNLALDWPVPIDSAADEINRFLDVTRRHHTEAKTTSEHFDPLHQIVHDIYLALLAIADGDLEWNATEVLFARFDDLAAATAPQIHSLLDHVMSHSDRADKAERTLARFVAELDGTGPSELRQQAMQEAVLAQLEQLKLNSTGALEVMASVSQGQSQIMEELPVRLTDIRDSLDREGSKQDLELSRLAGLAGMRQEQIESLQRQADVLSAEASEFRTREAQFAVSSRDHEIAIASLSELTARQDRQLGELASRLGVETESRAVAERQLRNELEEADLRWKSEVAIRTQLDLQIEASGLVVARMEEQVRLLSSEVAEQTDAVAQLKLERDRLGGSLVGRESEIVSLLAAISATEAGAMRQTRLLSDEVAEHIEAITRLKLDRDRLAGSLAERESEIVSLLAAISAAETEAVKQARQAAAYDAESLTLSMQNKALEARLHHSQEVVAHRTGEIEFMLASASWKATTPFRGIGRLWRRLFNV